MRIDVHNHALPERALDLLRRDPTYGVTLSGRRWSGGAHVDFEVVPSFTDPEAKLAELAAKGLDASVVSVAPPLFYYDLDPDPGAAMAAAVNEGLAEFCEAAPDRLRWLASIPLQDPGRAAGELELAAEAGCVGVEIGTAVAGSRLDEERFDPFWAAAERLDLPGDPSSGLRRELRGTGRLLHLANVLGFLFETTVAIERLICAGVLDRASRAAPRPPARGRLLPLPGGPPAPRPHRPARARQDSPIDPWAYIRRLSFDVITHDLAALEYLVTRVGVERVVMGPTSPSTWRPRSRCTPWSQAVGARRARAIAERNPCALYGSSRSDAPVSAR